MKWAPLYMLVFLKLLNFLFIYSPHPHRMQKFSGQGLIPHHSTDPHHTGSLTHWATRECPVILIYFSSLRVFSLSLTIKTAIFYLFLFYWSIVGLQCCVNFAIWQNDSVMHICIYAYFSIFFSIMAYHRILNIVLCAIHMTFCLKLLYFGSSRRGTVVNESD